SRSRRAGLSSTGKSCASPSQPVGFDYRIRRASLRGRLALAERVAQHVEFGVDRGRVRDRLAKLRAHDLVQALAQAVDADRDRVAAQAEAFRDTRVIVGARRL